MTGWIVVGGERNGKENWRCETGHARFVEAEEQGEDRRRGRGRGLESYGREEVVGMRFVTDL